MRTQFWKRGIRAKKMATRVADVLFGKVNPSGKLPLTFPATVGDTLARNRDQYPGDGTTVHYSENLEVGYRAFHASGPKPLFPFGFGLSYTSFRYSDLKLVMGSDGRSATVRFGISNTGQRASAEVAQLYLSYPPISEGNEPPRQLKGFRKISVDPGETKTVELTLDARSFSYWSEASHSWVVAPGKFHLFVGGSSADTPLEATVDVR